MPQPLRIALILLALAGVAGLLIYAVVRSFRRSADPGWLAVKWVVTLLLSGVYLWFASKGVKSGGGGILVAFGALLLAIIFTPMWAPHIAGALFRPLTSAFDGGDDEAEAQPLYSQAEAMRKRGKFNEAVFAIHEQLQRFPTDITGHMLLAEIQAENMNDLPGAEVTIQRLCAHKNHAPKNIAYALNLLADWHLKYAQDVEAAGAALQRIIDLFPGTDLAQTAANRQAHLGGTGQLLDAHERPPIALKPGVEYLGLMKDQSALLPKEVDPAVEADEMVRHLNKFPHDTETREQLARVYAEKFRRLDLATDQLEQLIALPHESPRHIARWLNLLADLQIACAGDAALATATLNRIVERYPGQSFAQLAQQRAASLGLEMKRHEKVHVVKFKPDQAG
jgi:outer membrane protein assembly factor BamD (BamD/ComL family)